MSGIHSFLKNKRDKVSEFQKQAEGRSNPERRELERHLLKPEPLAPYTGKAPPESALDPLSAQSVLFVFPSKTEMALFQKHFSVSQMIRPSVSNPALLVDVLRALDSGWLVYDRKARQFEATTKRSETYAKKV